ncbi:MAG: SRPBCC family protein [Myxococcales bacterium]|nr:SRPBCC family protein [Myxococcales bacterium]
MIYLSAELDIPRKPELVFQVLSDAAAYLAWVEGLVGVEHEGAPTFDEGSSFDVVSRTGRRRSRPPPT